MARLRFCSAIIQSLRVLFLALVMVISVADILTSSSTCAGAAYRWAMTWWPSSLTLILRACDSHWAVFRTRPRRPWSPAIVRPDVDATSWTFSSQLMKLISGSVSRVCLMLSGVSFIEGIVVLGWVVVLLLTLLRCCNNT